MKKILYTAIVIISIVFISCNGNNKVYKPTTTIIEGQITSPAAPIIVLKGIDEIKTTVDTEGKFFIQAELTQSGIYTIEYGHQSMNIFIIPGDRISLVTDSRSMPAGSIFKGDHNVENNYLVYFEKLKSESEPKDFQEFFTKKEADFLASVEERLQLFVQDQQEYQKKNGPFDEVFAELMSSEISYDAANLKLNYPEYYRYLLPDSILVLSDTYDSFFQNLDTDSEDNLFVPAYKEFVGLYLNFITASDSTNTHKPLIEQKFANIDSLFKQQKVKELLYYNLMKEAIDMSVNDASLIIDGYRKVQSNTIYLNEIENLYKEWSHLMKGQPAPGFDYPNIYKHNVSLQSLNGKVVYIDIWATWCGPCLHELPELERLQEKYKKSDNIAFVSISIDENYTAWEKMVKDKKLPGIQLIADNNWKSKIVSDYKINGIPRFIIINKDGSILDANAPRPSSKEIKDILQNAVQ